MGGFREDAARHPSRASAQATGSRARCTRSAGPQNAMHARGSSQYTTGPRRHRRHTTTTPKPTTNHTRHTGRAGGNSRNAATESKRLAPLKDCRRATDLSKPLSPPKSEATVLNAQNYWPVLAPTPQYIYAPTSHNNPGRADPGRLAEYPAEYWVCERLGTRVRSVGLHLLVPKE